MGMRREVKTYRSVPTALASDKKRFDSAKAGLRAPVTNQKENQVKYEQLKVETRASAMDNATTRLNASVNPFHLFHKTKCEQ